MGLFRVHRSATTKLEKIESYMAVGADLEGVGHYEYNHIMLRNPYSFSGLDIGTGIE